MDPRRIAKVFGTGEPAATAAGAAAAGMTPANPFSPGEPIRPYDGYSRTPRTKDFVTGHNINAKPRSHERVGFHTLRGMIEAYDVAQMCIWHRIDSIRSLDWSLVAAPHYDGDVTDAVRIGMAVLKRPDPDSVRDLAGLLPVRHPRLRCRRPVQDAEPARRRRRADER
jgi:hypothetical protein